MKSRGSDLDSINATTNKMDLLPISPSTVLFLDIAHGISVYYTSILIIIGCICCPLSIIVFSKKSFSSTSTSIYLRFLSLMDLGAILSGFPRFFLKQTFDVDIKGDNISCKTYLFFSSVFLYTSNWTLVVLTTERMISILWPHRVRSWSSKSTTKGIVLAVLIINVLFCLVIFGLMCGTLEFTDPVTNMTAVYCGLVYQREKLLDFITDLATIYLSFLPSLVIIICNVIIVHGVTKSRNRVKRTNVGQSEMSGHCKSFKVLKLFSNLKQGTGNHLAEQSQTGSVVGGRSEHSRHPLSAIRSTSVESASKIIHSDLGSTFQAEPDPSEMGISPKHNQRKEKGMHSRVGSKREIAMTRTLLVISTTFVICTFPSTAYGHTLYYLANGPISSVQNAVVDLLDILLFTNNSLNFFLYCITGSRFRKEVKDVLRNMLTFRCHQ